MGKTHDTVQSIFSGQSYLTILYITVRTLQGVLQLIPPNQMQKTKEKERGYDVLHSFRRCMKKENVRAYTRHHHH